MGKSGWSADKGIPKKRVKLDDEEDDFDWKNAVYKYKQEKTEEEKEYEIDAMKRLFESENSDEYKIDED